MRGKDFHDRLLKPLITEKSTALREGLNKISFIVSNDANKSEIARAVSETLSVKVEKVNVVNLRGKLKRMGRFAGRRPNRKKAIVTLRAGEKVTLFEG